MLNWIIFLFVAFCYIFFLSKWKIHFFMDVGKWFERMFWTWNWEMSEGIKVSRLTNVHFKGKGQILNKTHHQHLVSTSRSPVAPSRTFITGLGRISSILRVREAAALSAFVALKPSDLMFCDSVVVGWWIRGDTNFVFRSHASEKGDAGWRDERVWRVTFYGGIYSAFVWSDCLNYTLRY